MQGAGSCSELRPSLSTPPLPPNLCTQNKKHPHLPSNNTLYKITPRCLHRLKDKSFPAPLAGAISWFTGMLSRLQGTGSCSELRPSLSTPPLPPNLCTQNKKHPHLPSNNTLYKITPRCLHRLKDKSFPAPLAGAISWFTGMLSRLQGTGSCSELRPSLSAPPPFLPSHPKRKTAGPAHRASLLPPSELCCMYVYQ